MVAAKTARAHEKATRATRVAFRFCTSAKLAGEGSGACRFRGGVARIERQRNRGAALPLDKPFPGSLPLNPGYDTAPVSAVAAAIPAPDSPQAAGCDAPP